MNLVRSAITLFVLLFFASSLKAASSANIHRMNIGVVIDSPEVDSNKVHRTRIQLKTPPNVNNTTEYDSLSGGFVNRNKVGNTTVGTPRFLTLDEYLAESRKKSTDDYFRKRSMSEEFVKGGGLLSAINLPPNSLTSWLGGTVDLHPQGSAELIFGVNSNRINNPALSPKQRHVTQFDFDQNIQLNLTGNIGDKIKINAINDQVSSSANTA